MRTKAGLAIAVSGLVTCFAASCSRQPAVSSDAKVRDATTSTARASPPASLPASLPAADAAEIERLIKQLGAEKFDEREAAQQALGKIGPPAANALQAASAGEDPEVAMRAKAALNEAYKLRLDLGNKVTMTLTLIPAGKFLMGSPEGETGRDKNEGPQHEVTISKPFYMGVYEVTQEQYQQVTGKDPSRFKGAANPVENVSWDEAAEFCKTLSQKTGKTVRLPTEAQWEYACRAGTKTRFSFGDNEEDLGDYAWYGNGNGTTHPVGQKKPNDWGLYDMHGNVWEWCGDWDSESYANAKSIDPSGLDSGTYRVLRGGCSISSPQSCRFAYRNWKPPDFRFFSIGFRVAVDFR